MALPLIDAPKYEAKIPSTGKKILFRPYLVKEEKILMIAIESKDQKQIVQAMKDVISSCTFAKVDPDKLALFDLEYLFLKLRAKSVGEISKLKITCQNEKCKKQTNVEVNIDEINVDMSTAPSNRIQLTPKVGVTLSWPKIDILMAMADKTPAEQQKMMFDIMIMCIESIHDDKKAYAASETSKEELMQFIESLNREQFGKIQDFIENMPKLEHTIHFECQHCHEKRDIVLRGLQNFF